jgi:hypothetical protein
LTGLAYHAVTGGTWTASSRANKLFYDVERIVQIWDEATTTACEFVNLGDVVRPRNASFNLFLLLSLSK